MSMGKPHACIDPIERERARRRAAYMMDLRRIAREHYERENVQQLIFYLQNGFPPRVEIKDEGEEEEEK